MAGGLLGRCRRLITRVVAGVAGPEIPILGVDWRVVRESRFFSLAFQRSEFRYSLSGVRRLAWPVMVWPFWADR